ncbi:MAG: quinone-dependent dihydroorotate dehydrogenase [Patescibacteria group bacterium]
MFYQYLLKPLLFRRDPEVMHDRFTALGEFLGRVPLGKFLVGSVCRYRHPALRATVRGIRFENPIGLAAGFDKDMNLTEIIPEVGFGFMEVGSVTYHPYAGNPGKRLARLPKDKSLIVYYGLKSIGAEAMYKKIRSVKFTIPTGLNIAKTNRADIKGEKSVEDYIKTYRLLAPYFSYTTINISCPNAQDGCMFQEPKMLNALLAAFAKEKKYNPIFLKISNHLTHGEIDGILDVVKKYDFVDGFIISNLSKNRAMLSLASSREELDAIPDGGISGQPIKNISNDLIRYVFTRTKGAYAIVGLGGVFSAEDAYEKIRAGASLVQLITGMIYEGPTLIKRINKGLVRLLERDGFRTIGEAVGSGI